MLSFQDYGFPAIIEKVTASRMAYRKLARGKWDPVAKEWLVSPAVADDLTEGTRQCNLKSIDLVCDTAEEAIALFEYSRANGIENEESIIEPDEPASETDDP
jgi:hypothetical protein